MQLNEGPLNRRDAKSAEKDQSQPLEALSLNGDWVESRYPRSFLCSAISGFTRRRRRINAETQRFAEERRERRKKMLFSSALLRALCVKAGLSSVAARAEAGPAGE